MDACKPFSIKIDKNSVGERTSSPTIPSATCNASDGSDEDDDLPPNPFSSPIRPPTKKPPATPPRVNSGKLALAVSLSPTVSVNDDVVKKAKLEKERKHHMITNLVKRNIYQGNETNSSLEEHFKQGGIMARMAKREAKEEADTTRQVPVVEDHEVDYNIPPGLLVFVKPIRFVAEIEAPAVTDSNDPFEADLLTAPPNVLRELVISNTIVSMFCQKPVPVTIVRWLMTILLMSNDKLLSQAAFSVLTCLLYQAQLYSLPAESFHVTYDDMLKIMVQFGASIDSNGEIGSSLSSLSDFKLQHEEKGLLINNLNNFIKYLITLLTTYPQVSPLLCPEKLLVLLLKISLDSNIIDSILNVTILQCIGAVLTCYSEEEWSSVKIDELCQSFLAISDHHSNCCRIVTNIGNITTRSRQLQKQFARTVIKTKTTEMVDPEGSSDFDFVVAFIKTYNQKEEYDLDLLYCLMDVLSMYVSPLELSKQKGTDISSLVDYLSLLSGRIHDNPSVPITGFVKDSILRLRNVLQCVPGQRLQQQSILSYVRET